MNRIIEPIKKTYQDMRNDFPKSLPFIIILLGSLLSLIGVIIPFAYRSSFFSTIKFNLFTTNWLLADIILLLSIFNIKYVYNKKITINILFSIIISLSIGYCLSQYEKYGEGLLNSMTEARGYFMLSISMFLYFIGILSYIIMKFIYKSKYDEDIILEFKRIGNNIANFFRINNQRILEYRIVFYGIIIVMLSIFLPFISEAGFLQRPGISLSFITSLIVIIVNVYAYEGIKMNNEKNIYLGGLLNPILILLWYISTGKVQSNLAISYGFGYYIYIIGAIITFIGAFMHYTKHTERNKGVK
mgnify:CR=1 FL=1